jgi:hypothetical protein
MHEIALRVMAHKKNGIYFAICLETDVAVQADSVQEVKSKMRDALLSYFKSFESKEIEAGEYIRLAPLHYRIRWNAIYIVRFSGQLLRSMIFNINYNPSSRHLSFA